MADVLLSSLVETILTNLTSSVLKELGLAWGLETELTNLESTLSTIQAVLQDAETKQRRSEAVKNWLRKLKDAAYDAENAVDEFATEALKRKRDSQRGVRYRVRAFFSLRNRLIFRLKMGPKIKDIKETLDRIAGERNFHLEVQMEPTDHMGRQTSSLVNESEILGRNDEKELIIGILLEDMTDHDGVSVCAIYGMGGLGKTTLAKCVYNDRRLDGHFDLKIWVCVSNDFDIGRLTRVMVESIEGSGCNITDLDTLQRRLQGKLSGRKFFLVLDDVWNKSHEKWERLKDILSCGAKGSKVLVTTRSQKIAHIMAKLHAHHMTGLSADDSWSLFARRAFGNRRMEEKHELYEIGKSIVKKCGGLPLAVMALGSLMQLKSSKSEWLSVRGSEIWDLPDDESEILPALRLSYDSLPPHLRQCFAYCCIFPKYTRMEKDTLIELWMANGFIPSTGQTTLHDMGRQSFNDLVWGSFLQDLEENITGDTYCKMHDLMHDLAKSILGYECYIVDVSKGLKIPKKVRHLHLSIGLVPLNEVVLEGRYLRSFVLQSYVDVSWENVYRVISKQKYLRVLHFNHLTNIEKLPFSNFKLLRYLKISDRHMKSLPESICDLQNLETLKLISCSSLCKLPTRMKEMINLVYLDIIECYSLTSMPPKLGQLTSLRRLSAFIVGREEGYRIGELKELNLGGELSIKELDNVTSSADAKSANLKGKHDLVSLELRWSESNEEEIPKNVEEVLESLQPNTNLKKLSIRLYRGSKFPNWSLGSVPKNLVELTLYACTRCEHLPPLGKLVFLKKLDIRGMDSLKHFDHGCYGDGEISFQALETLCLRRMPSLEEWSSMDRQVIFPCLRELDIYGCPRLIKLPSLPMLKSLTIRRNELLLGAVSNLTSLSSLEIGGMETLPEGLFQNHNALKSLELNGCKIEYLSGLENLNSLERLGISRCDSLVELPVQGLKGLTSLRSLEVGGCGKLRSLSEGILHLTVLQDLYISECPEIQSFPEGMQHLDALRSLVIWRCEGLVSLPNWLGSLHSLSYLRIGWSPNLRSMPDGLRGQKTLRELHIWSCEGLVSLPDWLGSLHSLSFLLIASCPNLRSMPDGLRGQKTLRELHISGCPDLERRCKKEGREDWPKIAHIPFIQINDRKVQSLGS